MLKSTKLYSIAKGKCPKCHVGDFYITKNPYNLKQFDKMHSRCMHCGELFNKEVGFFYGAMYVSYGLNIGYGVGLFLLMVLLLHLSLLTFLFTFFILVVALFPITMRVSRLIYINLFVKYDASKSV